MGLILQVEEDVILKLDSYNTVLDVSSSPTDKVRSKNYNVSNQAKIIKHLFLHCH